MQNATNTALTVAGSDNSGSQSEFYVGHKHIGDEAICIDGLTFAYPDGTVALEGLDLHVSAGSTLAVIGPNGAGKTTLLKIMLGLLQGYSGRALVA